MNYFSIDIQICKQASDGINAFLLLLDIYIKTRRIFKEK